MPPQPHTECFNFSLVYTNIFFSIAKQTILLMYITLESVPGTNQY